MEITPDGDQWVGIHRIRHTDKGFNHYGKRIRDKWELFYTLTNGAGKSREEVREVYWEAHTVFKDAGWDFHWPYGGQIEFDPPIPVIFNAGYKLIEVGKRKEQIPDTSDFAWHESALPRPRKRD